MHPHICLWHHHHLIKHSHHKNPNTHVNMKYNSKFLNNEHKYAKACQLEIAFKLTSSCQQAPLVASSLELGFHLKPLTSWLTLPTIQKMSKSLSNKISAHMTNFLMKQFNSIRKFKGWWSITKMNGLPYK